MLCFEHIAINEQSSNIVRFYNQKCAAFLWNTSYAFISYFEAPGRDNDLK